MLSTVEAIECQMVQSWMYSEFEWTSKEAAMVIIYGSLRHLPEAKEESHEKPHHDS
jgi:hypothetical protein